RQAGPRRPRAAPVLQPAREGAEDDDQGPGRRRAGLRRRLQRGVRGIATQQEIATETPAAELAAPRGRARPRLSSLTQYAGFVPALVLFGLFFVVPLGLIVAYSFWQTVDYSVVHDWTLDNYRYFFSVPTYVHTMWATIWVAVVATALTLA